MSQSELVKIHTDGASRGNPGQAAYAYVIERPGAEDIEEKGCLPNTTNNIAEYTALIKALEHAQRLGARKLSVSTDSELMVRQIEGTYKVKNEGLRPLYEQIIDLLNEFESVNIHHVPRKQNARADRLCNEALDHARKPKTPAPVSKPAQVPSLRKKSVDEEAITCLTSVATAWAKGNPNHPRPEDVWEQLWTILEDAGVVRAK